MKFCSLMIGGVALPRTFVSAIEQALAALELDPLIPQSYFQWQNEFLLKTIYPMREVKLHDFLTYYQEVDVWSKYKDKDINALKNDVYAYKKIWESNAVVALKEYTSLRDYFLKKDVRVDYSDFQPIDETELTEINNLHALFASWPKDIRGERSFVEGVISYWTQHRNSLRDWINWQTRRHTAMDPAHPKYIPEGEALEFKVSITLPMAEQEMDKLRAFLATYDKIEKRKLDWYWLQKRGQAPEGITEAEFLVKYPPEQQVTIRDIVYWKIEEYTKSIAKKNQYELLDMINQRFQKEPERFPAWLQYMVVHFSGMRYASAHYSWADPKDLLVRLHAPMIEAVINLLDDAAVEKMCAEKIAAYESTNTDTRPELARAREKEWQDQIGWYLPNLKTNSPKTRRQGLIDLSKVEDAYEIRNKATQEVLETLQSMKATLPSWAWKELVKLTPLRVTEVSDLDWEKLTPQEVEERNAQLSSDIRTVMNAWENYDPSAWREEHGRTLELIVTRLVCNEAAEHCQHVRGQLPPGGLAARPKWYLDAEDKLPGAYFIRPTSEEDYTQGASILWLRFVNFSNMLPSEWQIAKQIETKQKVGLLPTEFKTRKAKKAKDPEHIWVYKYGDVTTRSRTTITSDKQKVVEKQWLRWIHEATVAEVAETADGMMVLTFETSLPGGDNATSAVGMHKTPLSWHLSDGTEDQYNRSFVGYIPEGQVPVEHLKTMLDWNKIFRKEGV